MVKKAGEMVGVKLRPHDLRRHAATYASRSGTPIEIVSKVILRHSDLSTTQRYLSVDGLVKSPKTVIPGLTRYPEVIEFTGFRLSPE